MQSLTKNGITVEWPDEPAPNGKYTLKWTALANAGSQSVSTQFRIVLPNGTNKTITFTQSASGNERG